MPRKQGNATTTGGTDRIYTHTHTHMHIHPPTTATSSQQTKKVAPMAPVHRQTDRQTGRQTIHVIVNYTTTTVNGKQAGTDTRRQTDRVRDSMIKQQSGRLLSSPLLHTPRPAELYTHAVGQPTRSQAIHGGHGMAAHCSAPLPPPSTNRHSSRKRETDRFTHRPPLAVIRFSAWPRTARRSGPCRCGPLRAHAHRSQPTRTAAPHTGAVGGRSGAAWHAAADLPHSATRCTALRGRRMREVRRAIVRVRAR
mmetsp:Transcript_40481/g.101254  ORF Transcript_40481/g.101254 Transcript_40481/m.101254 type:complete len:252 (+) Transcript_40481:418-1173(+)